MARALILFLLFTATAFAGDRAPSPQPSPTVYSHNDSDSGPNPHRYYINGLLIGAVLTCAGVSIYRGEWCWKKSEPVKFTKPDEHKIKVEVK